MPGHTYEQCNLIQCALCWGSLQSRSLSNIHPSTRPQFPSLNEKATSSNCIAPGLSSERKGLRMGFRVVQTPTLPLDVSVHLGLSGPYIDLYLGTPFGVAGWSPNPLPRQSIVLQPGTSSQPPRATQISIHKHHSDESSPLQPSHAPSGVFTTGSSSVCSGGQNAFPDSPIPGSCCHSHAWA